MELYIHRLVDKKNESIHESNFVKIPKKWKNDKLSEKWSNLFKIKQEANVAIEEKRSSKEIGSSLEAEIKLSINKEKFKLLNDIDLAEVYNLAAVKSFFGPCVLYASPQRQNINRRWLEGSE